MRPAHKVFDKKSKPLNRWQDIFLPTRHRPWVYSHIHLHIRKFIISIMQPFLGIALLLKWELKITRCKKGTNRRNKYVENKMEKFEFSNSFRQCKLSECLGLPKPLNFALILKRFNCHEAKATVLSPHYYLLSLSENKIDGKLQETHFIFSLS